MEFPRQRQAIDALEDIDVESFIVKSNVSLVNKLISIIFTSLMWCYTVVVFYTFLSGLLNHTDSFISKVKTAVKITNEDIRSFFITGLLFLVGSYLILFLWRTYNKRKFGSLNRRKMPEPTTSVEMLHLKLIDEEDFEKLQNEKISIFKHNPVKELKVEKSEN